MRLKWIEFLALMGAALVTGVFWGTRFTLPRSLPNFSAGEFIHIGKTIIANVATPMRLLMPATLLFILLAVWKTRRAYKPSFYFYLASLLLMVLTLIITVGVEVPIDNQIKTWTADVVLQNWQTLRHTWNQFHTIRTFTSIASLASFVLGLLKRTP